MDRLKLVAFDAEDLEVISAHLQDAVGRVSEIAYLPKEKRFAMVLNRFDWTLAQGGSRAGASRKHYERHRAALRIERVLGAKLQNIDLTAKDAVFALLAIRFEESSAPEGDITLVFAGGGAIRLRVECIETELQDLGAAWKTRSKPEHPLDEHSADEG